MTTSSQEAPPGGRQHADPPARRRARSDTRAGLWVRGGRAHIPVRVADLSADGSAIDRVEHLLEGIEGVDSATVNRRTGRVAVSFDPARVEVGELVRTVAAAEEPGVREAARGRPGHPGGDAAIVHQRRALVGDALGIGAAYVAQRAGTGRISAPIAAAVGLVEATPALRGPIERRLGPAADLGLGSVNALAQTFAGAPLSLVVDGAHRLGRLRELEARRAAWERCQDGLRDLDRLDAPTLEVPPRPCPRPEGPIDRYANRSALGSIAAAGAAFGLTLDPRIATAAFIAGIPKGARLGRESFASALGQVLAERDVLRLDDDVLGRLDRVDAVVLDSDVLLTGGSVIGSVWVAPERISEEPQLWALSHALLDPARPSSERVADGWRLAPVRRREAVAVGMDRRAWDALTLAGGAAMGLSDHDGLAAVVQVEPQLEPLARAVASAAREAGVLAVAGLGAGLAERLGADEVVHGGTRIMSEVQRLQREGHVVALVSARQSAALAAADVGIGIQRAGHHTPWGAHLLAMRGLVDAWLVLRAVPAARVASRRSVGSTAYGAAVAALLTFAGLPGGAPRRAGLAVNAAAGAAVAAGVWTGRSVGRHPEPVGESATAWHALPAEEVVERLASRADGLTAAEADARLSAAPPAARTQAASLVRATMEELDNPLTPVLAGGAGLSAALGALMDAQLIGSVMGLNAVIGGVQKAGADRAIHTLMDLTSVGVRVRRGGTEVLTSADHLVVGDVVVLRAGDSVPADCRLVQAVGVEVDESTLTGESVTVTKSAQPSIASSVADRSSMVYAGTSVAAGEATALVVATGDLTEVGRSAAGGDEQSRPSGVETRLRNLTKLTVPLALGAGAAVVGAGLLRGRPMVQTLGTGVGLAVAAVPEGLPLVATVAQLASARRLAKRRVIVRHPATIEALGRVNVLCADKTGTLTTGRIAVQYVSDGVVEQAVSDLDDRCRPVLLAALGATPAAAEDGHVAHPTDRAVLEAARAAGVRIPVGPQGWQIESELPFEPTRGYHAVLGQAGGRRYVTIKGSPEIVLPRCDRWVGRGSSSPFDPPAREAVELQVDRLAQRGYRVLAVARRRARSPADLRDDRVARLELLGLLAMADPVRPSAADAIDQLHAAGVSVVMLTGDHPSTARAIGVELGLRTGTLMTGPELDALTDEQLSRRIDEVTIFARVSPGQKVRIVRAMQERDRVVAMTGDGANDAAAIRLADVGVAIGVRATNAAKDAADVVVADDRIEPIVDAILEGRAMWASVRDAVAVLVGGNVGEIVFTLGSELLGPQGSPLNARQLLLINLLTDLVPALALAVRPPRSTNPSTLAREGPEASLGSALNRDIAVRGLLTAAAGGVGWTAGRLTGVMPRRAGTVALVSLVGSQLGQTLTAGWRNPLVVGSSVASVGALAAVVQTPGLSQFFGCTPLGPVGWGIGASTATASAVAAPLVHRLLDRIWPPAP